MKRAINLESWEHLLQLREIDGSPSVFILCKLFLESTPNKLITIHKGIQAGNNVLIASEAGSLKLRAANLGALTFSQLCTAIEGLAQAGIINVSGDAILGQLQAEYVRVVSEVQTLIQEAQGNRSFERTNPKLEPKLEMDEIHSALKVMIIDDDAFYRTLLTRTVEQIIQKPEVIAVDNYLDAVTAVRESGEPDKKPFDLIIADLNLKTNSTGIDVWRISQIHAKNSAFLLISGTPLDEFLTLVGEQAGEVPSYLPKPFRLDHARAMLHWLLRSRTKGLRI